LRLRLESRLLLLFRFFTRNFIEKIIVAEEVLKSAPAPFSIFHKKFIEKTIVAEEVLKIVTILILLLGQKW
jgi:hypothetical protein